MGLDNENDLDRILKFYSRDQHRKYQVLYCDLIELKYDFDESYNRIREKYLGSHEDKSAPKKIEKRRIKRCCVSIEVKSFMKTAASLIKKR